MTTTTDASRASQDEQSADQTAAQPAAAEQPTPPPPTAEQTTAEQTAAPHPTAAPPNPGQPTAEQQRPPLQIPLTILHLAAYGIFGFAIIGALFAVLGAGIGLLFLLGFGVVVLVGLVYALFGISWFETLRVSGLYNLESPPLRWRAQQGPGFQAWLRTLGRQSLDGRMWRGVASFAIASVFGATVLGLIQWFFSAVFSAFGLSPAWLIGSVIGLLVSAAGVIGLALLYRLIAIAIARVGVKEAELTQHANTSARQREGAVRAADVERTRIERDLHDGVQPRLVSVGMTLGLAQQKIDSDPEGAKALVAEAHTSTKAAITELRQLARGIYASVLDDRGLDAALSALAARSHIPVQLDVRIERRCSRDAEAAVYFAIAESLTNAAKHSRASEARVVVRVRDGDTLWARVEDNGIGGAVVAPGGGLDGVANRVVAAGGTCHLDSPQGGPTALEVSVPCGS